MKAVSITAIASGQGKTLFTMSLLYWLKHNFKSVRGYKIGPDYIDTQFQKKITGIDSINLDLQLMSEQDVNNSFAYYAQNKQYAIIEGVMGFYDGIDFGSSTYEVSKLLNVPTIMVISAEGTYSTLIPVIKGIIDYKKDNTIKGIVLNKISSQNHYEKMEKLINNEIPELKTLGWIKKGVKSLNSRHLGLDLRDLDSENLGEISQSVLENIKIPELLNLMEYTPCKAFNNNYLTQNFNHIKNDFQNLEITIVKDKAFSFVYKQNLDFFEQLYGKVNYISALKDQKIPFSSDVVYMPGGYVETPEIAEILANSHKFKNSLKKFAEHSHKKIYAECAGLMYLGEKIQTSNNDWINGAGLLPLNFELQKTRNRLGYYKAIDNNNKNIYKGHAFHYSKAVQINNKEIIEQWNLYKNLPREGKTGAWSNRNNNILGTYLHSILFNQPELVLNHLKPDIRLGE